MQNIFVFCLAVGLSIGLTCKGAPDPASDVKAAVLGALDAVRAENKEALRQCVFVREGDEEAAAWLPLVVDGLVAQQRLGRLYAKAYGKMPPTTGSFPPDTYIDDASIQQARHALDASKIEVEGPTARLTFSDSAGEGAAQTKPATTQAGPEAQPGLVLRRIDDVWKIDLQSALKVGPARGHDQEDVAARRAEQQLFRDFFARRLKAWKEVADGIEQRRYRSAEEAEASLSQKG